MIDLREAARELRDLLLQHFAENDPRGEMPLPLFVKVRRLDMALAALAREPEPAIPAGWRLVPTEATADMRNAFHAVTDDDVLSMGTAGSRWHAMLSAAPAAPAVKESLTVAAPAVEGEPVAWALPIPDMAGGGHYLRAKPTADRPGEWIPLYTAAPPAKREPPANDVLFSAMISINQAQACLAQRDLEAALKPLQSAFDTLHAAHNITGA